MNKRGFTLTEMLGVIIILALLALLIFPTINGLIKNSKESAYEDQVEYIYSATTNWLVENSISLSKDTYTCLSIETLKTSGFMDNNTIVDPRDNSEMNGYVKLTYNESYKQFDKEYVKTCE